MSDLALLLLAAGESSRLGKPKQLLPIQGVPILRRAAKAAVDCGCRPIIVVLGAGHDKLKPLLDDLPVQTIVNPNWNRGIGTSIRAGVETMISNATQVDRVMILLADQPAITPAVIKRLHNEHERAGKSITVSSFGDSIGPPVILSREYFARLLSLPDDQGAKSLWQQSPGTVHRAECPEAGQDIDTPADYQRYSDSAKI